MSSSSETVIELHPNFFVAAAYHRPRPPCGECGQVIDACAAINTRFAPKWDERYTPSFGGHRHDC